MTTAERTSPTQAPDPVVLAATLSDLARATRLGVGAVDRLTQLALRCVELLPVAAAGLLVVDPIVGLRVIGSSSDAAELLDLYQVQNEEGPCLECTRSGEIVRADALSDATTRWPRFGAEAQREGFSAVYAVPLAGGEVVIGALNLFASSPLSDERLAVAQALADAAALALLQADPLEDRIVVSRRLHAAVEARNSVEQAKGMLAQRFDEPLDAAFRRLRSAAASSGRDLAAVAADVTLRREDEQLSALLEAGDR